MALVAYLLVRSWNSLAAPVDVSAGPAAARAFCVT